MALRLHQRCSRAWAGLGTKMVARVSGTGRVVTASQIRDNSIAKQTMLLRSSLVEKIVECAKAMSLANKLIQERGTVGPKT